MKSYVSLCAVACLLATACSTDAPSDTGSGGADSGKNNGGTASVQVTDDMLDVSFIDDSSDNDDAGVSPDDGSGSLLMEDGTQTGPNGCPALTSSNSCASQVFAGETLPLDIYIMFDQSGSMLTEEEGGVTRIDAVRDAVTQFMQDEDSSGIGVGIGYFGHQPLGETTCDLDDFSSAAVEIGTLPEHASDITDSLAKVEPVGETPTGAAIRGACNYASGWNDSNGDREVVILLVTDGEPKAPLTSSAGGCTPTLADAVDAAQECHDSEALRTYVLGVGPFLDNLGDIATAGGTEKAYIVEGGDVAAKVLEALTVIRGDAIPCKLALPPPPPGEMLDLSAVNLGFSTAQCTAADIYYVESAAQCDADVGGWYYDDPTDPDSIQLCPLTCDDVNRPGGQLYMTLGCETRILIR